MFRKILLTGTLLVSLAQVQAQTKSKAIIFETKTISRNSHGRESRNSQEDGQNAISLGLGSWYSGYNALYYERYLLDFLSIQIGGGFTYRSYANDAGAIIYSDGSESSNFSSGYNISDQYWEYKYRKARPGQYFSLAPRFYPSGDGMNSLFLSPMIEYKRYNFLAQKADETYASSYPDYSVGTYISRTGNTMKEHMNCLDLTINIGGMFQCENHLSISWNVGFGVRHLSALRQDLGYTNNGTAFYVRNMEREFTSTRPVLSINFAIGGWF